MREHLLMLQRAERAQDALAYPHWTQRTQTLQIERAEGHGRWAWQWTGPTRWAQRDDTEACVGNSFTARDPTRL